MNTKCDDSEFEKLILKLLNSNIIEITPAGIKIILQHKSQAIQFLNKYKEIWTILYACICLVAAYTKNLNIIAVISITAILYVVITEIKPWHFKATKKIIAKNKLANSIQIQKSDIKENAYEIKISTGKKVYVFNYRIDKTVLIENSVSRNYIYNNLNHQSEFLILWNK